jgi:hypothetical protein
MSRAVIAIQLLLRVDWVGRDYPPARAAIRRRVRFAAHDVEHRTTAEDEGIETFTTLQAALGR